MDSPSKSSSVPLSSITQGHTKTLNFYQVGKAPGKAVLVDAPGYGGRGRPEWGKLFDHYIDNRKE
jgi:GTP-binding protein